MSYCYDDDDRMVWYYERIRQKNL